MEYDFDVQELRETQLMFEACPDCPNEPTRWHKGKAFCEPHYIAVTSKMGAPEYEPTDYERNLEAMIDNLPSEEIE